MHPTNQIKLVPIAENRQQETNLLMTKQSHLQIPKP